MSVVILNVAALQNDPLVTFSGKVHGFLSGDVRRSRNGEDALENGLGPQFGLGQHLVNGHVVKAVAFDHQSRRLNVVLFPVMEQRILDTNAGEQLS